MHIKNAARQWDAQHTQEYRNRYAQRRNHAPRTMRMHQRTHGEQAAMENRIQKRSHCHRSVYADNAMCMQRKRIRMKPRCVHAARNARRPSKHVDVDANAKMRPRHRHTRRYAKHAKSNAKLWINTQIGKHTETKFRTCAQKNAKMDKQIKKAGTQQTGEQTSKRRSKQTAFEMHTETIFQINRRIAESANDTQTKTELDTWAEFRERLQIPFCSYVYSPPRREFDFEFKTSILNPPW